MDKMIEIPSLLQQNALTPIQETSGIPNYATEILQKPFLDSAQQSDFLPLILQKREKQRKIKRKTKPLLTFKILYYDRQTHNFKKEIIKAKSIPAVVFRYSYYSSGYENMSRSEIRYPPCRVCGARKPFKNGNTTQMLRHIRMQHSELEKQLQQNFSEGDKKSYFINLCENTQEYPDIKNDFEINEEDYELEQSQNDGLTYTQIFDEYQNQRRNKYLYSIKNPSSIQTEREKETYSKPKFSHEEGIFDDFPQNYLNKFRQPTAQMLEDGYLSAQLNLRETQFQRRQKGSLIHVMNIDCKDEQGKLIGRIHYTKQIESFLYGDKEYCDSLLISHIQATLYQKTFHPSYIYFCTQDQTGYPSIPIALSLINWQNYPQIQIILQKLTSTLFPVRKWPQFFFYCGHKTEIKEHIVSFILRKKNEIKRKQAIQAQYQRYLAGDKFPLNQKQSHSQSYYSKSKLVYELPWEILRFSNRQYIKHFCLKLYSSLKAISKQCSSIFQGYILTASFLRRLSQKIAISYTDEYKQTNDVLNIMLNNNVLQNMKEQSLQCEIYTRALTGFEEWLKIMEIIRELYARVFCQYLKQMREYVYLKNYKKLVYLYIYAKYSLVAYRKAYLPYTYQVVEHSKKNKLKNKRKHLVTYNQRAQIYECQCHMNELMGLPCSHIIRVVLQDSNLLALSRYIDKKWILNNRNITFSIELKQFYQTHEHQFCQDENNNQKNKIEAQLKAKHEKEEQNRFGEQPSPKTYHYYGILTQSLMQYLILWL